MPGVLRFRNALASDTTTSLLSQGAHPRLWMTTQSNSYGVPTVSGIRSKIQNYYSTTPLTTYPDIAGSFNTARIEAEADMTNAASYTSALYYGTFHALCANVLTAGSLGGSTYTAAQHGTRAANLLSAWITALGTTSSYPGDPNSAWIFPFIYDWAYTYVAANSTLLADAQAVMSYTITNLNADYDNHAWKADTSKEMNLAMCCALAGYEPTSSSAFNTVCSNHIARYATRFISPTGVLGEQSVVALSADDENGMIGTSGMDYVSYEWPWWVVGAEAYRTAATTSSRATYYADDTYTAIPSVFYSMLRNVRPYARSYAFSANGYEWLLNRGNYTVKNQSINTLASGMIPVAAAAWKDVDATIAGHMMWVQRERIGGGIFSGANNEIGEPPSGYYIGRYWPQRWVLEDPTITPVAPTTATLATSAGRFGDGRYDFRSDWDGDASTNTNWHVRFWLPKYLLLPDGRGSGELVGHHDVMYKGPATMIRGDGAHNWGGHGAFNLLYFRDTNITTLGESFVPDLSYAFKGKPIGIDDYIDDDRGNDVYDGSRLDLLDETRKRFASTNVDCDYVFGDITRWYASSVTNGLYDAYNDPITTLCHVHFCLFRFSAGDPIFVVKAYRYTTTSTRFEPTLCWNPSGDSISLDATVTVGQPNTRYDGGLAHARSTDSRQAVASQNNTYGTLTYNNKSVLTVVRPAARTMIRAGGPHATNGAYYNDTSTHEHIDINNSYESIDLYGNMWVHNTDADDNEQNKAHAGHYGIQIQPTTIGTTGSFLIVNETIPNASGTPTTIEDLTNLSGGWAGCAILATSGKRIFAFNESGDASSGGFRIPSAGTYKMLLVTLSGSSRTITASVGATVMKAEDSSGSNGSAFTLDASQSQYFNITCGANCDVTIS